MGIIVDFPDTLVRELKTVAARRGASVKSLIRAALEEVVRKTNRTAGRRVKFALLDSHEPGTLNLTNVEI